VPAHGFGSALVDQTILGNLVARAVARAGGVLRGTSSRIHDCIEAWRRGRRDGAHAAPQCGPSLFRELRGARLIAVLAAEFVCGFVGALVDHDEAGLGNADHVGGVVGSAGGEGGGTTYATPCRGDRGGGRDSGARTFRALHNPRLPRIYTIWRKCALTAKLATRLTLAFIVVRFGRRHRRRLKTRGGTQPSAGGSAGFGRGAFDDCGSRNHFARRVGSVDDVGGVAALGGRMAEEGRG